MSKIDICNMALAHLGQEPIASLSQEDEKARRCSLFYEPVKREVLRTHNWAFAGSVASLALLAAHKATDGWYAYAYPQDCLFLRRVFGGAGGPKNTPFKEVFDQDLHARVILSPVEQARAEYTRDITDENLFDPAFAKAFALALAADMAVALTGDQNLSQQLLQKYAWTLEEARRSNMSERLDIHRSSSAFAEAR